MVLNAKLVIVAMETPWEVLVVARNVWGWGWNDVPLSVCVCRRLRTEALAIGVQSTCAGCDGSCIDLLSAGMIHESGPQVAEKLILKIQV